MISAILAVSKNNVIGKDEKMPWDIKEDMNWFVEKTINNAVVMGRKTWDSLGKHKPLKNRKNVVISSKNMSDLLGVSAIINGDLTVAVPTIANSWPNIETIVMGGAEIYEQCFPICDKIYLTRIHKEYIGDTFVDIDKVLKDFKKVFSKKHKKICTFEIWERDMSKSDLPLDDLIQEKLFLKDFTEKAEERGIHVVQIDEIVTMDIRDDFCRFFPITDDFERVIGGSFR